MTSGEHTKGPLKWHRRFSEQDRNGSIYSEPHEGHVYAVAMQPQFVTDEQWAHDANLIVTAVNTYPAVAELVEALHTILANTEADAIPHIAHDGLTAYQSLAKDISDCAFDALTRFREAQAGGGA